MTTSRPKPRVLLTNDDGPPTSSNGSSPFIYPLALALRAQLGWEVHVVVPSTNKSWVGKSYAITEIIKGHYYLPAGVDGTKGTLNELPFDKAGEEQWILIDGTPATCANLGLHSLFPKDSFDLCISGPNFGRNTGNAFALSSGTIGAALAGALSHIPSIAISFGLMEGYKPPPAEMVNVAISETCKVVEQLWNLSFGNEESGDKVDVYSVNVPLMPKIMREGGAIVEWTSQARTGYGRLFKSVAEKGVVDPAGPAAIPEPINETVRVDYNGEENQLRVIKEHETKPLKFAFGPNLSSLLSPATLEKGTDNHALHAGHISVTPLRSAYEPARAPSLQWKL